MSFFIFPSRLILFFTFLNGPIALAQNLSDLKSESLTEEQVLKQVFKNNYDLRSSIIDIDLAQVQLVKAGLWSNPEMGFSASSDLFFGHRGEGGYEYSLSQNLVLNGRISFEKKIAFLGLERSQLQVQDLERKLKAQAKKFFYQIITLQEEEKNFNVLVKANQRLLDVMKSRYQQGELSLIDVNTEQGSWASALQSLSVLKARLYEAQASLNRLMGQDVNTSIQLKNEKLGGLASSWQDLKVLTQEALANRLDLKIKAIEDQMGKGGLDLAYALRIPDITLSGFYQTNRSRFDVNDVPQKDNSQLLGIRFSLPLPFFNNHKADITQARAQEQKAVIEYEGLILQIQEQVARAYIRVHSTQEILSSYQQGVVQMAEKSFQLTQKAYTKGQVSFVDVVQSQGKLMDIKKAYLEVQLDAIFAVIDLESETGESLIQGNKL